MVTTYDIYILLDRGSDPPRGKVISPDEWRDNFKYLRPYVLQTLCSISVTIWLLTSIYPAYEMRL